MIHASSLKFVRPDIRPRSSQHSIDIHPGIVQNKTRAARNREQGDEHEEDAA